MTVEVVDSVLSADLDALEATLTRHGYNARTLAELLNVRPAEIRAFLRGQPRPTATGSHTGTPHAIADGQATGVISHRDRTLADNLGRSGCLQAVGG